MRTCKLNPDRKPLTNHKCNFNVAQHKDWNCQYCDCVFDTKSALYEHLHNTHNIQRRIRNQTCPYCGVTMQNKRKHLLECPNRRHKGFTWTNEEKKKLSDARKKYLANNLDKHPWKKNSKFKSEPCEYLKKFLKEHNYVFEEEFTDPVWLHKYSADICFTDKRIIIEVNGNQHYTNGQLTDYYQARHDYLVSQGYKVIEFHYSKCYKESDVEQLMNELNL